MRSIPAGAFPTLRSSLGGAIPEPMRERMGNHVFGCDICQDVCPWNRRAPISGEPAFAARNFAPPLERLASVTEQEFREMFQGTPVVRARYAGFLRNVAIAMGNARSARFRGPLEKLAGYNDPLVRQHATWALATLERNCRASSDGLAARPAGIE